MAIGSTRRWERTNAAGQVAPSAPDIQDLLEPFRTMVAGRAALEKLDRAGLEVARAGYADVLRVAPHHPGAHVGLADTYLLRFESTRADLEPDRAALQQAEAHAREACRLEPGSSDAWITLAWVRYGLGDQGEALAAGRMALAIDPHKWQHHLLLAFVSWGEQRLQAAHQVLRLCPGLALAHWLAATVFVARQAFAQALVEIRAGCAAQDAQRSRTDRFRAVGLHLLHGLVLAATGADEAAFDEWTREFDHDDREHVFARECAANTWYACGALHWRHGRRDEALTAFRQALVIVPGQPCAAAALALGDPAAGLAATSGDANRVEAAIATAIGLAWAGRHDEAARHCDDALAGADIASAGWRLPVEPLLRPTLNAAPWAPTLARLRERAT